MKEKDSKSTSFPQRLKPGAFPPLPALLPEMFSLLNLSTVIFGCFDIYVLKVTETFLALFLSVLKFSSSFVYSNNIHGS